MSEEKYLLKDNLFNEQTVLELASCLSKAYPDLDPNHFVTQAIDGFPALKIKKRMSHVRLLIEKNIKEDYYTTLEILLNSLKYVTDGYDSFVFGAYQDYIMVNGCTDEYLFASLKYMGEFTKYFSAEFAIRTFINQYPEATFEALKDWAISDNVHQRRLASEGLRPKLPWSIAIAFDYKKGASLLDHLFCDSERYVTRSVANHLNDISKFDPSFCVETLKRWQASNRQDTKEMKYIINHALRTSVKRAHEATLEFLGYPTNPNITISPVSIQNDNIRIGESLIFSFEILANEKTSLMIDYNINYPMAKGKRSEKVFKIKKICLNKDESFKIEKKHGFKVMTTKKLYTGDYTLNLQINGKSYSKIKFYLEV